MLLKKRRSACQKGAMIYKLKGIDIGISHSCYK